MKYFYSCSGRFLGSVDKATAYTHRGISITDLCNFNRHYAERAIDWVDSVGRLSTKSCSLLLYEEGDASTSIVGTYNSRYREITVAVNLVSRPDSVIVHELIHADQGSFSFSKEYIEARHEKEAFYYTWLYQLDTYGDLVTN